MDDRRIRKSKEALKHALLLLLQKTPLNQIRINHLCKLADVNRSTFYNNYADIDALFQDVCLDFIASITNRVFEYTQSSKFHPQEAYPIIYDVLTYMREHDAQFLLLISQPSAKRFEEQLYWYYSEKYRFKNLDCAQRYHFLSLLISSFLSIHVWMLENYPISTHEMTQLLINISSDTFPHFEHLLPSQA